MIWFIMYLSVAVITLVTLALSVRSGKCNTIDYLIFAGLALVWPAFWVGMVFADMVDDEEEL